jgi:hypothetical protein
MGRACSVMIPVCGAAMELTTVVVHAAEKRERWSIVVVFSKLCYSL